MNEKKKESFLLNINIIEGRHYIWPNMNSVVFVIIDKNQKHVTRIRRNTNSPYYNEFFCFEFTTTLRQLLDKTLTLAVLRPWSIYHSRKLLGDFSLDLATIWNAPNHQFYQKWVALNPPKKEINNGLRGFLKLNLFILCKGQSPKIPVIDLQKTDEIEGNLLIPGNIFERQKANYIFNIYKGKNIIKEKFCFSDEKGERECKHDPPNSYIEVSFAGLNSKTSVKKKSISPIWNERLIINELFPPLCQRIKFYLHHKDGIKDVAVALCYLDLNDISRKEENGFLPTFGPGLIHFYFDKNECYAGNVIISIETVIFENTTTSHLPLPTVIEQIGQYLHDNLWIETNVILWACIFHVNMINKKLTKKSIKFELLMGGICGYQENDKEVIKNLSPSFSSQKNERYSYLNFGSEKPVLKYKSKWYNLKHRLFISNLIEKIVINLKEKLSTVEILFINKKDRIMERKEIDMEIGRQLKLILNELRIDCRNCLHFINEMKFPTWSTKLDFERRRVVVEEMIAIENECQVIYDSSMKIKTFRKTVKISNRLEKLIKNAEECWPYVYVWMLYGERKIAFYKIDPKYIIHNHDLNDKRGNLCFTLHSAFFQSLNKNKRENDFSCRADIILWIGEETEESFINHLIPEGFTFQSHHSLLLTTDYVSEFTAKFHIYSARITPGGSRSGLINPFLLISLDNFLGKTKIKRETLNPIWKETLVVYGMKLYGTKSWLKDNPPVAIFQVLNKDETNKKKDELIGSAIVKPSITFLDVDYNNEKNCKLRKHDVFLNLEKTGEIVIALQLVESDKLNEESKSTKRLKYESISIPPEIMMKSIPHRMEVYFWGLRDLKTVSYLPITKPKIIISCAELILESSILNDSNEFLNFSSPIVKGNLLVPFVPELIAPLYLKMFDIRSFGRLTFAGTNMCYIYPFLYMPLNKNERNGKLNVINKDGGRNFFKMFGNYENEGGIFRKILMFIIKNCINGMKNLFYDDQNKFERGMHKGKELFANEDDWWTKYFSSVQESSEQEDDKDEVEQSANKYFVSETVYQITVYTKELENQSKFEKFEDKLTSFPILRNQKTGDELVDSFQTSGILKAAVKVYPWPFPDGEDNYVSIEGHLIKNGIFQHYESNNPVKYLVRIYVIKGVDLRPKDRGYKSDSYLILNLAKQKINDVKNYVPGRANPYYGRCYEFNGEFPKDYLLKIEVWDRNVARRNRLIGETKIDLENRVYTKHRATCGLSPEYITNGPYKWRDQKLPTQILMRLCKINNLNPPEYFDNHVKLASKEFYINKFYSNPTTRKENLALAVLRRWNDIPIVGCHLVPEHVETRSLYNPSIPGLEQGKLQMWIDIFPFADLPWPPKVDVTPRKPISYELRIIIWNTLEVTLNEDDFFTGEKKSDIYIKGWLSRTSEMQHTDVHYRSFTGEGNFNWRFLFRFDYLTAEDMIVYHNQEGKFLNENVEFKVPCKLNLQVWDSETFTPDDFLGTLTLQLSKMPRGSKTDKKCSLANILSGAPFINLFKVKRVKGWWPFVNISQDGHDKIAGKLEAEFELVTVEEAEKNPVGRGREPPQPLPPPKRPAASFSIFRSPLYGLKFLICKQYRGKICLCFCIVLFILFLLLFIYSIPKATVERILTPKKN